MVLADLGRGLAGAGRQVPRPGHRLPGLSG